MSQIFKTNQFEDFWIRKATENDVTLVISMLKAAAKRIRDKGIDQWGFLLSGGEDEEIKRDIQLGTTYVVENHNSQLVASFNFSDEQNEWDLAMWGERNDNAFYIHRLVVSENYHHQHIGSKLLNWIDKNLRIQNSYIRLDCVANNPVLNTFYHNAGFTFIGYQGEGNDQFSLYEKAFSSKS